MSFLKTFVKYNTQNVRAGLFGLTIACINIYNIKRKKRQDEMAKLQYFQVSVIKGLIYGSVYPFSLIYVCISAMVESPENFNSHFIPLSKYGNETLRQLKEVQEEDV